MSLEAEIEKARKEIVADGYDMSFGEVMNLYRDEELIINPDFQRLFRWGISRKTRFIESLLLGIPIPPIFVFQNDNGVWELIDGLQRLSTVLEFSSMLRLPDGGIAPPSILEGTKFLPNLTDRMWETSSDSHYEGIGKTLQLQIKRARIRVEILKKESDVQAKYELFQRLNTGGEGLSEQEVRNCVAVMLNKSFHDWMMTLANNSDFITTINQTDGALAKQSHMELVLRFLAFRNVPYQSGLDVHEYLDDALINLASQNSSLMSGEENVFQRTFHLLNTTFGSDAFKKWNGQKFEGKFLMSLFEVVATGVSKHIDLIEAIPNPSEFVTKKSKAVWEHATFQKNSGAGVRGTTRLTHLLPMAQEFFRP